MKLLIVFLLLLTPFNSFSTTIIIVISNNVITIGTDSKVNLFVTEVKNGKAVFSRRQSSICKISKIYDFICTGDGILVEIAFKCSKDFLNPKIPIGNQLNALCTYMIPKFIPPIELERRQNRASYIRNFKKRAGKDYFNDIVLCCFENGKPVVYTLEFECVNNENKKVEILYKISKYTEGTVLQSGRTDFIHQSIVSGAAFKNKSIPNAIYDLINIECTKEPEHVGGPIDVIEITGQGKYNWVYSNNCKF